MPDTRHSSIRVNQSCAVRLICVILFCYKGKGCQQSVQDGVSRMLTVFRDLDFKTIDKLCKMNKEFEKFIEQTEKLMTASEKYVSGAEKELDEFCDGYFANDTDIENYCREKHIPTNKE